jgi:hypothetical protein
VKTQSPVNNEPRTAILSLEDDISESMNPDQQDFRECDRLVSSLEFCELLTNWEE